MAESLSARNIVKRYGGVVALSDGNLDVHAREVVALIGANGSGKSTMSKVINGVVVLDGGQLLLDGQPVHFPSPQAAKRAGIATVFQELSLIPQMTVAENIWLTREPLNRLGMVDRKAVQRHTEELLALADWLMDERVTHAAMESTGVYWKPVWYVLEDSFELLLVNAAHVKHVPGRKTDLSDAQWLAQLLEHGLLRGSFVPPKPIRELRDLTASLGEDGVLQLGDDGKGIDAGDLLLRRLGIEGRPMLGASVADTFAARLLVPTSWLTSEARSSGHDLLALADVFRTAGHELIAWRLLDLEESEGRPIDAVVATKFPSYAVRHPRKVVWLLHQFRQAYELDRTELGQFGDSPEERAARRAVHRLDRIALGEARKVFATSRNVADRLARSVAIVGSRSATTYGEEVAAGIAAGLPLGLLAAASYLAYFTALRIGPLIAPHGREPADINAEAQGWVEAQMREISPGYEGRVLYRRKS